MLHLIYQLSYEVWCITLQCNSHKKCGDNSCLVVCGQQWWNVVTQWDLCHVTSFDTLSPTSSISLLCCQNMDPDHQVDDMTWKLGKFIDV